MDGGITYILFTVWLTGQNYGLFYTLLVVKPVNSSVMFLQTWHIELSDPRHPTVLSTGYNVDLTI